MLIENLSAAQRTGQRLMVGFDGTELNDQLKFYIEQLKVGGLILFARNIESPDQIETLCLMAQEYAASCGQPPLFIAIDQEGGVVSRLKPPFTQFAGNPHMKTLGDAAQFASTTARELGQIGVNMNMAPVLDVVPQDGPSVMQKRAFGHDPDWVARMGASVIDHQQQNGIMAVAKHFPGIGRTVLDSHVDLPDLEIDTQTLAAIDLIPFRAAINAHVAGMMLSHIRYTQLDPKWPASLSPRIVRDLLRNQMEFSGLVITDDLDMGAIDKHYAVPTIVAQCLSAEIDILLICHPGDKIQHAFDEISKCCRTSEALADQSEQSLKRIFALKDRYF